MNPEWNLALDIIVRLDEAGITWVKNGSRYFPTAQEVADLLTEGKRTLLEQEGSATYQKGGIMMYKWENNKIDVYVIEGEL